MSYLGGAVIYRSREIRNAQESNISKFFLRL